MKVLYCFSVPEPVKANCVLYALCLLVCHCLPQILLQIGQFLSRCTLDLLHCPAIW